MCPAEAVQPHFLCGPHRLVVGWGVSVDALACLASHGDAGPVQSEQISLGISHMREALKLLFPSLLGLALAGASRGSRLINLEGT